VPGPVVIHLSRPYANAEEYLAREAWSIDTRSMLLVGQAELPTDTDVVFDVTLADGSKPIRAEARVVGAVAPSGGRPGGLKVRFKRYGAATRAFVERAVSARRSAGDAPVATPDPPPAHAAPASVRPQSSVRPPASVPPSAPPTRSARPSGAPVWEEDKTSQFSRAVALARPMAHVAAVAVEVDAPSDREVLLERLRKRARETEGSGSQ
jgi:hypothetical protein